MLERSLLVPALLVLAGGCRQPNPEWQGPAAGDGTTAPATGDATSEGASTSESASSTEGSGSVTTAAPECTVDEDCAEPTPLCIDDTCVGTGEGTSCQADAMCPATAPFCNPEGECQDGNEGDPCDPMLPMGSCSDEAPYCAADGMCHDGSPGDPCDDGSQCASDLCDDDECG